MPRIAAAEFVSDEEEGGEDETGHKEEERGEKENPKSLFGVLEVPPDQQNKLTNCRD